MKRYLDSERGYTMLIVVGILVIFTIIGMSLMSLNLNSLKKNESRESNTQAKDLSVKGIDYILAEIDHKMMKETISVNGITYGPLEDGLKGEAFIEKFTYILNSYKCEAGTQNLVNTHTGEANYCVSKIEAVPKSQNFQQYVSFKSVGTSNSKEHLTESTFKLGADVNNDAFNYALMTYDPGERSDNDVKKLLFKKTNSLSADQTNYFEYYKKTNGNIDLHGGLKVVGDIRSEKDFYISDQSRYKNVSVNSILPLIQSDNPSVLSRIELNGNKAVLQNSLEKSLPNNNIKSSDIAAGQGFSIKSSFEPTGNVSVDFDIVNKVNNAKFAKGNPGVSTQSTTLTPGNPNYALVSINPNVINGSRINTTNYQKAVLEYTPTSLINRYDVDWHLNYKNNFNTIAFPKGLNLTYGTRVWTIGDYDASTAPIVNVSNYAYIQNNLVIGLNHADETNFDIFNNYLSLDALGLLGGLESLANLETPVELNGTYYVNGDLIIIGAKLTGNATIFVKGNTYIAFSEIGVPHAQQVLEKYSGNITSDSNISIFSHGPMDIKYISNNHNNYMAAFREVDAKYLGITREKDILAHMRDDYTRSVWNGHLHSDTAITLDNASSYLTINGSISAPKIFATSIKGRAEASCKNIGTYLDSLLRFVIGDVLSILLGSSITNFLENLVLGSSTAKSDFQMTTVQSGTSSNCFQKADLQSSAEQPYSNFTASLLNLNLLPWGNNQYYAIEPRLIINYSQDPKINYLRFVTIDSMETPQQISRE